MGPSTNYLVHYVSTSAPPVPTIPKEYVPTATDVWFAPVPIVPPDPALPGIPFVTHGDNVLIIKRVAAPEHRTDEFVLPDIKTCRATQVLETGKPNFVRLKTSSLPLGQELVFDPRNINDSKLTLRISYHQYLDGEIEKKKSPGTKDKRLKSYSGAMPLTYADAAVILGVPTREVQRELNTMRRKLSMEHLDKA